MRIDEKMGQIRQRATQASAVMSVEVRDTLIKLGSSLEAVSERLHAADIKRRKAELRAAPPETPLRGVLTSLALLVGAALLPLMAILPIAPGLVLMIEMEWQTDGYGYLLITPLLAITYVVMMCLLTVFAKHVLMGKVKPGRYSLNSFFYVRFWFVQQINDLALRLLHPIYATLYVLPWYRALGVKVGRRAEISTAAKIVPDLVEIGPESFIADAVQFGAARVEPGAVRLEHTRIGRRSFIGNSALLPTGATIGDEVLIGVLSKPPEHGEASQPGGTWFGSPPLSRGSCRLWVCLLRIGPSAFELLKEPFELDSESPP